jgi:hypothetical protein
MSQSLWLAGSQMVVTIDAVEYPFRVARWEPKAKMINRSNSKYSPGYEVKKGGVKTGTITCEGPYKEGEAPLEAGEEYTFVIKPVSTHVGFSVVVVIESLQFSDDVEDGPNVSVTAQTQSDFNPIIL